LKLLLDTTYLLPAIGISIRGIPEDAIIHLMEMGHQIMISNITIFELSAKGAKQIALGDLTAERVSKGIRAIVYDDRMGKIPTYDTSILLTAFRLRRTLSDFIDCLILSSAVNGTDALVSEDKDIHDTWAKGELPSLAQTINPEFEVLTVKHLI